MKLIDLIKVMDIDTKINVTHNNKELFDVLVCESHVELDGYDELEVKAVWFSPIYNRIMIEI